MKDNQQAGIVVFGQDALVEKLVNKDKNVGNIESNPIPAIAIWPKPSGLAPRSFQAMPSGDWCW